MGHKHGWNLGSRRETSCASRIGRSVAREPEEVGLRKQAQWRRVG